MARCGRSPERRHTPRHSRLGLSSAGARRPQHHRRGRPCPLPRPAAGASLGQRRANSVASGRRRSLWRFRQPGDGRPDAGPVRRFGPCHQSRPCSVPRRCQPVQPLCSVEPPVPQHLARSRWRPSGDSPSLIDWATAAPDRLRDLRLAYERLDDKSRSDFARWRHEQGERLEAQVRFDALQAYFYARDRRRGGAIGRPNITIRPERR